MIVDSSAIVAVFLKEPGFGVLVEKLGRAGTVGIGSPTLVETAIVLSARLDADARGALGRFIYEFGMVVIPFGELHWRAAVDAYWRFGRGRHAASLNFGDCLTYATASLAKNPLLCVGEDFSKTDLDIA